MRPWLLAEGRPSRITTSRSPQGAVETWSYFSSAPGVGFSLGATSYGPLATGVSVGQGPQSVERLRVTFQDGRVVSVDQVRQP